MQKSLEKGKLSNFEPKLKLIVFFDPSSMTKCIFYVFLQALQPGLRKNKWTQDEDHIILDCINKGITKWSDIATYLPGRLSEQIKERWINSVNPDFKRSAWTEDEIDTLKKAQQKFGNRWSM